MSFKNTCTRDILQYETLSKFCYMLKLFTFSYSYTFEIDLIKQSIKTCMLMTNNTVSRKEDILQNARSKFDFKVSFNAISKITDQIHLWKTSF